MPKFLIGAFNIKLLGRKKLEPGSKTLSIIIKILRRYDIIFIQEIKEVAEKDLDVSHLINDLVPRILFIEYIYTGK